MFLEQQKMYKYVWEQNGEIGMHKEFVSLFCTDPWEA